MPHDEGRRTLTDTGPIVAMIDPNDKNHDACWAAMRNLPYDGMITPAACLVEILYLLGKAGGHALQSKVWAMIAAGALQPRPETVAECVKAGRLMESYSDIPMDYADAVLVVAADALKTDTIFTIDQHFYAYRKSNGNAFTIIR